MARIFRTPAACARANMSDRSRIEFGHVHVGVRVDQFELSGG